MMSKPTCSPCSFTPCDVKTIATKDVAAQGIALVPSQQIKSFKRDYDFDRKCNMVTAIDVDNDNNVILAGSSCLKMFSQQGKYIKQCQLDGISRDLSCHKTTSRTVVSLQANGMHIIDNFIPQPKIPVPCYGITFINDNIAVTGKCKKYFRNDTCNDDDETYEKTKIRILDYNGEHIKTITAETTDHIYYLHHHQGKLYMTDNTEKVYCVKEDGTELPAISITVSQKLFPSGVTTDHKGNLYVASWYADKVFCLSQDGKHCELILESEGGIKGPNALCFSRDYKTLFVYSSFGKVVKAFKCEY